MTRRRPHLDPAASRRLLVPDEIALEPRSPLGGRARFEAALALGATAGGRASDKAVLEVLAGGRITGMGEVPYGSNAVFVVELDAADPESADEPLRAIYKPVRGERPLWDFPPNTLYLREVATYRVDAALGFGHVPPTALRDGPVGPGSLQLFVRARSIDGGVDDAASIEQQLREIAALDVLVNNADRKRAHLLVTPGPRLRAIDNALTFLPYPRQRTALIDLGGSRVPDDIARRLTELAGTPERREALQANLAPLLARNELDAFMHRVDEFAADPVYPELDDWDGRPFEWW